jgi:hypothetical protein
MPAPALSAVAKRVVNALTTVLTHNEKLREQLVIKLGFAVQASLCWKLLRGNT